MRRTTIPYSLTCLALALACAASRVALASVLDHREFDATLHAPFRADPQAPREQPQARSFTLDFDYPQASRDYIVDWALALVDGAGRTVQQWRGRQDLADKAVSVTVRWSGQGAGGALAKGIYQARMHAVARPQSATPEDRDEVVDQSWDIDVGPPPSAPPPSGLVAPPAASASAPARAAVRARTRPRARAAAGLPYKVYLGNLHSQTGHSDGGGPLATCTGAQEPQSAALGPADAYAYAQAHGLDILMASEHNHMYDGSDGTNANASAQAARALYQAGRKAASSYNAAHPGFLALYGMEWGVIANGGHLNIFNSPSLLGWERNGAGELIGDIATAKGDYAALYALMREHGWLGQFNHPAASGQFQVGGVPLAYTADGDNAMALCEVLNTSAFSANDSETETRRSSFEVACNKLLEAGYHVAFSSDQDNHCANWGASYTNRTGVLIARAKRLTTASFLDAVRARRVFATMDKGAQLILVANGHVMGERFANSGSLALSARYASSAGRQAAQVQFWEGVPGRNGAVTLLASVADTTITPSPGLHFYYAKVTQDDGNLLWSAPVWVAQETPRALSLP
jgi:hypothetical protein